MVNRINFKFEAKTESGKQFAGVVMAPDIDRVITYINNLAQEFVPECSVRLATPEELKEFTPIVI